MRTVKTASGATAVQIVHLSRRGSRDIKHIGSAHDETERETLKAVARQIEKSFRMSKARPQGPPDLPPRAQLDRRA